MEHCGLLAQVSKADLTNVCSREFYSTYLSPNFAKCRKSKLSQILPDIPYQTSMKPQQISPPGLARSSAAKLVRDKGTSSKAHSNNLLVYIWWLQARNGVKLGWPRSSQQGSTDVSVAMTELMTQRFQKMWVWVYKHLDILCNKHDSLFWPTYVCVFERVLSSKPSEVIPDVVLFAAEEEVWFSC